MVSLFLSLTILISCCNHCFNWKQDISDVAKSSIRLLIATAPLPYNHAERYCKLTLIFFWIFSSVEIKKLSLGSLDYCRDWTFSGDVVDAAMLALDSGSHPSYVIGTGISKSIRELVELTFNYFDLDWTKYIEIDEKLLRKNDPIKVIADPKLIMKELNWQPTISFQSLVNRCISKS